MMGKVLRGNFLLRHTEEQHQRATHRLFVSLQLVLQLSSDRGRTDAGGELDGERADHLLGADFAAAGVDLETTAVPSHGGHRATDAQLAAEFAIPSRTLPPESVHSPAGPRQPGAEDREAEPAVA